MREAIVAGPANCSILCEAWCISGTHHYDWHAAGRRTDSVRGVTCYSRTHRVSMLCKQRAIRCLHGPVGTTRLMPGPSRVWWCPSPMVTSMQQLAADSVPAVGSDYAARRRGSAPLRCHPGLVSSWRLPTMRPPGSLPAALFPFVTTTTQSDARAVLLISCSYAACAPCQELLAVVEVSNLPWSTCAGSWSQIDHTGTALLDPA